jgi:hypothetical protein
MVRRRCVSARGGRIRSDEQRSRFSADKPEERLSGDVDLGEVVLFAKDSTLPRFVLRGCEDLEL